MLAALPERDFNICKTQINYGFFGQTVVKHKPLSTALTKPVYFCALWVFGGYYTAERRSVRPVFNTTWDKLNIQRANVRAKVGIGSRQVFGLGVAALPRTNHGNSQPFSTANRKKPGFITGSRGGTGKGEYHDSI